jgi:ribosomal protein S18 acetylase RimI-like enzyme
MYIQIERQLNPAFFEKFWELYQSSFPEYEQRSLKSQLKLAEVSEYKMLTCVSAQNILGFLAYWEFENFLYLEHLAIDDKYRGNGLGSELMRHFMKLGDNLKIILEIDPVEDALSERREMFYHRLGFKTNNYDFINPGYIGKAKPHKLILLSKPDLLDLLEYQSFVQLLYSRVLKY